MNGLLFLNSNDFSVQEGVKGKIMCTNIQGFSLIFFYSSSCVHCETLKPIFKKLPGYVSGCRFGMINISQNKKCILLSRETIAPIKEVPYVILYVNGRPHMRYRGPHDITELTRFIKEVADNVNSQKNQQQERMMQSEVSSIPEYTIGRPLCGPDDNVCYLEFDNAYNGNQQPKYHNSNHYKTENLESLSGMVNARRM